MSDVLIGGTLLTVGVIWWLILACRFLARTPAPTVATRAQAAEFARLIAAVDEARDDFRTEADFAAWEAELTS